MIGKGGCQSLQFKRAELPKGGKKKKRNLVRRRLPRKKGGNPPSAYYHKNQIIPGKKIKETIRGGVISIKPEASTRISLTLMKESTLYKGGEGA